jgi:glycosyltransferase involved in cell wall biosynthesis
MLNVGSHLWNKGLDIIIKAFSVARKKNKNLKLLLKDQRSTYLINSDDFIKKILVEINDLEALNNGSINVIPGHLNLTQINILYNISDYYLTPYRAEGFNLPALEAATAGTRVIATKGGATDDFLIDKRHIKIQGKYIENGLLKEELPINAYVEPSLEDLIYELINSKRDLNLKHSLSDSSWFSASAKLVNILKFNK